MLTLNPPIRQVHDTSRQQLERAHARVIAQARELGEDLKEGERVVVYFKSGDDRVQVSKIKMDEPYLKLEGKDVNGNDTAILITPNDLHYFAFKVEKLPPDKSFGF